MGPKRAKDKCCVELKAQKGNLLSLLPNEDLTRVREQILGLYNYCNELAKSWLQYCVTCVEERATECYLLWGNELGMACKWDWKYHLCRNFEGAYIEARRGERALIS